MKKGPGGPNVKKPTLLICPNLLTGSYRPGDHSQAQGVVNPAEDLMKAHKMTSSLKYQILEINMLE